MKRWEIVNFLRDVRRLCGDTLFISKIWLRPTDSQTDDLPDSKDYELVIKGEFDEKIVDCIQNLLITHNMEMTSENGLWIISKRRGNLSKTSFLTDQNGGP